MTLLISTHNIVSDFRLDLFGGFQLFVNSDPRLSLPISAKKARALFSYLALNGKPQSREKLASVLWADSNTEQARVSLRQALTALRKNLGKYGDRLLRVEGETISLSPDLDVDVRIFESNACSVDPKNWEDAIKLYSGELLEGFVIRESAFDDWIDTERERLRHLVIDTSNRLLEYYDKNDLIDQAIQCGMRLATLDPLQENAHRILMGLYRRQGRYTAALKQYRLCQAILQRELGVSPDHQTEALYRSIVSQRQRQNKTELETMIETDVIIPPVSASNHEEWRQAIPELRYVTIVLIDIQGPITYGLSDETLYDFLKAYHEKIDVISKLYEGSIVSKIEARVTVVFGAITTHGNDSERAVHAALDIVKAISMIKPQPMPSPQVGIASGQLLVNRVAENITVTGEPIRAATYILNQAKEGTVLISNRIFHALSDRLDIDKTSRRCIKMVDSPMHVWEVGGFRDHHESRLMSFVGRQSELRLLSSLSEACFSSVSGRVILIRGEAGIGKSVLVAAFDAISREHGFTSCKVLITDFGMGVINDPIKSLTRNIINLSNYENGAAFQKNIISLLEDGVIEPSDEIFLSDMLDLPLSESQQSCFDAMDGKVRRRGMQQVLIKLLQHRAAKCPLHMIIEDIHWADQITLQYLAAIASALNNYAIIMTLTTRTENDPLDKTWRAAAQGCALTTIDLGPLSSTECNALANCYGTLDDEFVRSCIKRSEGNPLFLNQLLRMGKSTNALPDSLQSIVLARLDCLPLKDRKAVQTASVLGQYFDLDTLHYLLDDTTYTCDSFVEQVLIRHERDGFLFLHALIQEAIYASILKSTKQLIHKKAAEWYATRDVELEAEHLDAAEDVLAADAYFRAAMKHMHAYRNEKALELAKRGAALAVENELKYELHQLIATLLRDMGKVSDSIEGFQFVLTLAKTPLQRCKTLLGIASVSRLKDKYDDALSVLFDAETAAREIFDNALLAEVFHMRGNIYFPLGNIQACLTSHEHALNYARRAQLKEAEARSLSGLGDAYYQRGLMITAFNYFQESIELARSIGATRIEMVNLPMICVISVYKGDVEQALASSQAALNLAAMVGDYRTEIISRTSLTALYQFTGEWERSKLEGTRAVELARYIGASRFESEASAHLAMAFARLGDMNKAEDLLEKAWGISKECGLKYSGPTVLGMLANCAQSKDRRRWALQEGEALLALGCVSHAYLDFYKNAILASVADANPNAIEHYSNALKKYTEIEPLPWSNFYIQFGQGFVRFYNGDRSKELIESFSSLYDTALKMRLIESIDTLVKAMKTLKDSRV